MRVTKKNEFLFYYNGNRGARDKYLDRTRMSDAKGLSESELKELAQENLHLPGAYGIWCLFTYTL